MLYLFYNCRNYEMLWWMWLIQRFFLVDLLCYLKCIRYDDCLINARDVVVKKLSRRALRLSRDKQFCDNALRATKAKLHSLRRRRRASPKVFYDGPLTTSLQLRRQTRARSNFSNLLAPRAISDCCHVYSLGEKIPEDYLRNDTRTQCRIWKF